MKTLTSGQTLPKQLRDNDTHVPNGLNDTRDSPAHEHGWNELEFFRIAFVALAAAAVWFHSWEPFQSFSLIGVMATLIGGYPIFREAIENVLERRMTMELSMTIALLAALFIRQFFTALVITLFVLVAEVLEGMTVNRGRKAIKDLLSLLPQTAEMFKEGTPVVVPLAEIQKGDRVLVRPGARIPVDGEVYRGTSYVDQAAITGESMPVEKSRGASVYAGTINQTGVIEAWVTAVGKDSSFGKIIEAVERAEHSRAPIQRLADQLAGYLVYFALGAAVLTFLLTHNLRSTISVIIVAGACGIAAGTPLALLGAIGRSARAGVIIKGGLYLEQLAKVDTVVLDKTGTLTFGLPAVVAVNPAPGIAAQELLRYAAIAERYSEHPVGRAVVEYARCLLGPIPAPTEFQYVPGKGVTAEVEGSEICVGNASYLADRCIGAPVFALENRRSGVLVTRNRKYLGAILVDDQLRDEAIEAIRDIRAMGIETILLTGDSTDKALRVAAQLQMDEVHSDLQPHEKLAAIQNLQTAHKIVAMVGDGINDAPALAQADVGIAMGSGTDVARESADVVLIGNNLLKLRDALRIARSCRSIIYQNFYGTLAIDLVGIVLAAYGFLTPLLAALIHVTSELAFILNSTRLLPSRRVDVATPAEKLAQAA
jgi:heavy metal translocating P-type ATPase